MNDGQSSAKEALYMTQTIAHTVLQNYHQILTHSQRERAPSFISFPWKTRKFSYDEKDL